MECVAFHATELFDQIVRLFLTVCDCIRPRCLPVTPETARSAVDIRTGSRNRSGPESHPGPHTARYDAENRLASYTLSSSTTSYKYGPQGRRVQKVTPSVTETYVYDAFGKLAPEYSTAGADPAFPQTWNAYAYVNNNSLKFVDPSGRSCVELDDGSQGDDGDGIGCAKAGVAPSEGGQPPDPDSSEGITPEEVVVEKSEPNLIEALFAPPVPRYVENDMPLSDSASAVLSAAGEQTVARLDCLGLTVGGGTSVTAYRLGQPIPDSKPFLTPGASKGTSFLSEEFGERFGKSPKGIYTPLGGPGTGEPFRFKKTAKIGRVLTRYAPFLGALGVAASAVRAFYCTSL